MAPQLVINLSFLDYGDDGGVVDQTNAFIFNLTIKGDTVCYRNNVLPGHPLQLLNVYSCIPVIYLQ